MQQLKIDKSLINKGLGVIKVSVDELTPENYKKSDAIGEANTLDTVCMYVDRLAQIAELLTEYKALLNKDLESIKNYVDQLLTVDKALGQSGEDHAQ